MTRALTLALVSLVVGNVAVLLYQLWRLRAARGTGDGAPKRSLRQRLDEMVVDPEAPNGEWSSRRFGWLGTLATYNLLNIIDPEFRDPASFVIVLGILSAAAWGSSMFKLDLTTILSRAADRIAAGIDSGRSRTETREKTQITETVAEGPMDPGATLDVDRSGVKQEP